VNLKPLIPFVVTAVLWGVIYLGFEMKINPSSFHLRILEEFFGRSAVKPANFTNTTRFFKLPGRQSGGDVFCFAGEPIVSCSLRMDLYRYVQRPPSHSGHARLVVVGKVLSADYGLRPSAFPRPSLMQMLF
jgi:hypothetical protein